MADVRADPGPPPTPAPAKGRRPDVFLSYSRRDTEFVRELAGALTGRGKDVWVDYQDILPTEDWWRRVRLGIEASKAFAAVLTPDFLASVVAGKELAHAVESHKRLVPLLRRGIDESAAPAELTAPNWIRFTDGDEFDGAVDELVRALETDLEWLDAHARLLVRAQEWDGRGRDTSPLLRGRELVEAEAWAAEQGAHAETATALQREYVLASRRADTHRRRVRLGLVLAALFVSLALTAFALVQRSQAITRSKIALSRQLATSSLLQLSVDPQQALVLAIRAARARHTDEAERALREAILGARAVARLDNRRNPVAAVAFDPRGSRIATVGDDGVVRLWSPQGRLLRVLRPTVPPPAVTVAFSADGRRLLAAGGALYVWDLRRGVVHRLGTGGQGLVGASFSRDGRRIVTAGYDGAATVWAASGAKRIARLDAGDDPLAVALLTPDGNRVVSADLQGRARLWSLAHRRTSALLRAGPVDAIAITPQGLIVTAGRDRAVRLWRPGGRKALAVLRAHTAVATLAVSPDGREIAAGESNGTAEVWNTRTRKAFTLAGHTAPVGVVAFSSDGRLIVTAGDRTARLWTATTGDLLATLRGHAEPVRAAAFAPAGRLVLTGSVDGSGILWRTQPAADVASVGVGAGASSVAVGANGAFAIGGADGSVRLWTREGGAALLAGCRQHAPVASLAFAGARTVVTAGADGAVEVCRLAGGRSLRLLPGTRPQDVVVVSSRDGTLVAATGRGAHVWRLPGAEPLGRSAPDEGDVHGAAFSPDGTLLATAGDDGTVRVRRLDGGRTRVLGDSPLAMRDVAFSPDGSFLAAVGDAGGGPTVRLFRMPGGEPAGTLKTDEALLKVTFSPDGTALALAGASGTAWLWRPSRDRPVVLGGGFSRFVDISFSDDGRLVVAASEEGTAPIWTVDGKPVTVLRDHTGPLAGARFSPDGALIVTAGAEDGARIVACDVCGSIDDLVSAACSRLLSARPALCPKKR